jgi:endonuclease/exonuclease/phosphatase family metal-dependent hydrolase
MRASAWTGVTRPISHYSIFFVAVHQERHWLKGVRTTHASQALAPAGANAIITAMKLRVATFNVENLASRHRFNGGRPETTAAMSLFDIVNPGQRETIERSLAVALADEKRQMTALALAETRADIVAMQEVDNLTVLQAFFANYVHRIADHRYGHFAVSEGNDPRGIDVAFAARRDLLAADRIEIVSNRDVTFGELDVMEPGLAAFDIRPDHKVFNRDCMQVELTFSDRTLTLFICHLKSMNTGRDDGRQTTLPIRRTEARAVRRLIERRFGEAVDHANWIVLGDLNGYEVGIGPGAMPDDEGASGLEPLTDGFASDPVAKLPFHERWSHFRRSWSETRDRLIETHMQLDYVLLSPALARANPAPPVEIVRRGLPYRVPLDPREPDRSIARLATTSDRYPNVGWDRPKASDHCPVVVELDIPRHDHPLRGRDEPARKRR